MSRRIDFYDHPQAPAANSLVPSVNVVVVNDEGLDPDDQADRQRELGGLTARALSGQPTPGSESSEVRWVSVSEVPGYTMDRSMRIRINDFLTPSKSPVIT